MPHDSQASPANRVRLDRSVIEIAALEQEVWKPRDPAKLAKLVPEPASLQGKVKIGDGFALDENAVPKVIVADGERPNLDESVEVAKRFDDTALSLERVDSDWTHWR